MKIFRSLRSFLFIGLAALFTSCVVESEFPLSLPGDSKVDERLDGVWALKKDGDTAYIHFRQHDEHWTDIAQVIHEKENGLDVTGYTMFPTKIGERTYMNIVGKRFDKEKPDSESYTFVRYELTEKGELVLRLMSMKAVAPAIEAGKLKGEIKHAANGEVESVELHDSPENLTAFVTTADDAKLFPDIYVAPFKKLPAP